MEEPKKVVRCHFLGVTQVPKATGIAFLEYFAFSVKKRFFIVIHFRDRDIERSRRSSSITSSNGTLDFVRCQYRTIRHNHR